MDAGLITVEPGAAIAADDSLSGFAVQAMALPVDSPAFEVINRRLLCVDIDGFLWIKRGTVVAYHGHLKFRLDRVVQADAIRNGPARSAVKREFVPLCRAIGRGRLYLSNNGQGNRIVRLNDETLFVSSENLVAFESTLCHEILTLGSVGALAGGLLVVKLSGSGRVAISAHGEPLALRVTPDNPVATDPTAVLAWTSHLWPSLKSDLELRLLVAHGGGAPIQMAFEGDGWMFVHGRNRIEAARASIARRVFARLTRVFL